MHVCVCATRDRAGGGRTTMAVPQSACGERVLACCVLHFADCALHPPRESTPDDLRFHLLIRRDDKSNWRESTFY